MRQGFDVSSRTVLRLLHRLGYSLQANAKVTEGRQHPDRDAQFRYLNDEADAFIDDGQPVISVDTKKKELIGNYANGGAEWAPAGEPERVNVHDFADRRPRRVRKGHPVWDLRRRQQRGLGQRRRHRRHRRVRGRVDPTLVEPDGQRPLPRRRAAVDHRRCRRLERYRVRAWKVELARLAERPALTITVCHYPPGTSKWNRIEHRMFSFITMNWRGRPLTTLRTIIELISATATTTGLTIQADYDANWYPKGVKITDKRVRRSSARTARLPRRMELHHQCSINPGVSPNAVPFLYQTRRV